MVQDKVNAYWILGQALHRLDRQWRTLLKIATRMGLAKKLKKEKSHKPQASSNKQLDT
jgi:hypothetical protein